MKRATIILLLLSALMTSAVSYASNPTKHPLAYNGFSGGMMLHAGWVWGGNVSLSTPQGTQLAEQKVAGFTNGIGGQMRFHFGKHLRIGAEGYGTYLGYGKTQSKFDIGWGGISIDYQFNAGRFYPYAGITVGGGSATNLTLLESLSNDLVTEQHVSYRKYAFAALTPFIGVEYEISQRLRLILKADWLLNVSNPQPDFPKGPRIYIGFSFYHMNK